MIDKQKFKNELENFTGTQQYYEHRFFNLKFYLTDGIHYVREQAEAHWLIDLICSFQPQLRKEEFQVWTLKQLEEKTGWNITCTDGNKNVLISQFIPFSDFPLEEFVIWKEDEVILLPSEH